MSDIQHQRLPRRILMVLLVGLLVLLRVVHLDSDAYARLSWSSALLTDEGFYLHNARNVVLCGHARTDAFNNALIMPLLHGVQVLVFSRCGVGAIQARSISVVCSLLTLLVFFHSLQRAFGTRAAWLGLVLLGLDPVFVGYNRLALMDTPACLPLVCAFYGWTRGRQADKQKRRKGEGEKRRRGDKETVSSFLPLFLCGLCLGLAYTIRGLAAILLPVPFLLLLLRAQASRREKAVLALYLMAGMASVFVPYLLLWYWPHHLEIARANTYYLNHQLKPDSLRHLWQNVQHAFFGDDRGLSPYLFRHSPITFALALLWLTTQGKAEKEIEEGNTEYGMRNTEEGGLSMIKYQPSTFLSFWLLLTWLLLAVISYAPDRYYVLFYPAMCGLAALAICDLPALLETLWQARWKRTLLGGFLAYHLGEAFLHHQNRVTEICLYAFTGAVLVTLAILPRNMSQWREQWRRQSNRAVFVCLLLWALVAAAWTTDWLRHLEYTQRDADQWLAANLPPDSVLIGDVAPGLCLNNHFRCINVIPGLCNDKQPVERFAPAPRYIVILDGKFKEPWWRKNYPQLVAPGNQLHLFPRIIRLSVGIYEGSGARGQGSGNAPELR